MGAVIAMVGITAAIGSSKTTTTSETATPSRPASRPFAGTSLFEANFEPGLTDEWCFYQHTAVPHSVVTSPVREGTKALRTEIRDGALVYDSERSEVADGPSECPKHRFAAGDETWTAVSVFPEANFPAYSSWSLVAQWKEPHGGTPPQQINLQNDRWAIVGSDEMNPRPRFNFGTLARGQWNNFIVHHKWSTDPSVGFVEVYFAVGGGEYQLALPKTFTRTMDTTTPLFLSVGQYRDTDNRGTAVMYVDSVRVGTTREVVTPTPLRN